VGFGAAVRTCTELHRMSNQILKAACQWSLEMHPGHTQMCTDVTHISLMKTAMKIGRAKQMQSPLHRGGIKIWQASPLNFTPTQSHFRLPHGLSHSIPLIPALLQTCQHTVSRTQRLQPSDSAVPIYTMPPCFGPSLSKVGNSPEPYAP